jgi:hypothetical protein
VGCAVDTAEVAALFDDETEFYADTRDGDLGGIRSFSVVLGRSRSFSVVLGRSRAQREALINCGRPPSISWPRSSLS